MDFLGKSQVSALAVGPPFLLILWIINKGSIRKEAGAISPSLPAVVFSTTTDVLLILSLE
jgi:hypothetical protein